MTFGKYWKDIRGHYDYLVITDNDGNTFTLDEDTSEILHESKVDLKKIKMYNDYWSKHTDSCDFPEYAEPGVAGCVEFYYEKRGCKLTFNFPYEQEIKISKDHIKAYTIDYPNEKCKLQFYRKNKIINYV